MHCLRELLAAKRNKVAHAHRGRHIFGGQNFSAGRSKPRSVTASHHRRRRGQRELANFGRPFLRDGRANFLAADAMPRPPALATKVRVPGGGQSWCGFVGRPLGRCRRASRAGPGYWTPNSPTPPQFLPISALLGPYTLRCSTPVGVALGVVACIALIADTHTFSQVPCVPVCVFQCLLVLPRSLV